jgi:curved DNA-binding protein CbpA
MAASSTKNYYDLLEIHRNSTEKEVRKGYKLAALKHHPDKGGDEETFKKLNLAFNILSDPKTRTTYDRELERTGN